MMEKFRRWRQIGTIAAVLLGAGSHGLSAPRLDEVSPRGLQSGSVNRLVVRGTELTDGCQFIVGSGPSAAMGMRVLRMQSLDDGQLELTVDVAAETPPGLYPVRLAGPHGVSNLLMVGVDPLPQLPWGTDGAVLPVAWYGTLTGDRTVSAQFAGTAGARMQLDVEAQRLGSKLRPVLRLIAPSGRLVATAQPSPRYGGDARISLKLPEDGKYTVELRDLLYQGAAPGAFRLKLGDLHFADVVFPLALSGTRPVDLELISDDSLERLAFQPPTSWDAEPLPVRLPSDPSRPFAGPAPWLHASRRDGAGWLEADLAAAAQPVAQPLGVPLAVQGRLTEKDEVDQFRVGVTPGQRLRFTVDAAKWGAVLDAVLEVQDGEGHPLATADDSAGTMDPELDLEVPAGVNELRVRVRSLAGHHGPAAVYHLQVAPSAARPSRLQLTTDRITLPAGQPTLLPLDWERGDVSERLQLDLPAALRTAIDTSELILEPDDEVPLLAITAHASTRGVFTARLTATAAKSQSVYPLSLAVDGLPRSQYAAVWREECWLAVTEPTPLRVAWLNDDLPDMLVRGTTHRVIVNLPTDLAGPVRLSLLTTQRPPMKTVDNQQVEDLDKKLRMEQEGLVVRDRKPVALDLIVPADLPVHSWAFAVRAELLSDDEQTVGGTALTHVVRRPVRDP